MSVLELPATAESVPRARRFLREQMTEAGTGADLDTASLLVTEIVTNALLHAVPPLSLTVEVLPELVRVEVRDGSPAQPRVHTFTSTAATGRGLRLLDTLAASWGVEQEPSSGKVVWFEVGPERESAWAGTADAWLAAGEL